jgi:hypothetical protein
MQWACDDVPCDCSITMSYTVVGSSLRARYTLNNNRTTDKTVYPKRTQEIPAVYVNGFLDTLVAYQGTGKPCTGAALTEIPSGWNPAGGQSPWIPGIVPLLPERWMAFVQTNKVRGREEERGARGECYYPIHTHAHTHTHTFTQIWSLTLPLICLPHSPPPQVRPRHLLQRCDVLDCWIFRQEDVLRCGAAVLWCCGVAGCY